MIDILWLLLAVGAMIGGAVLCIALLCGVGIAIEDFFTREPTEADWYNGWYRY